MSDRQQPTDTYKQTLIAAITAESDNSLWIQDIFLSYQRKDLHGIGHAMDVILTHYEQTLKGN